VSQNGWLLSRRGRSLPANASGFDTHRDSTGTAFVIPAGAVHSFNTAEGETLDVFAFHPDSDFGPTGTDHPVLVLSAS
jgi:hypothetical protein